MPDKDYDIWGMDRMRPSFDSNLLEYEDGVFEGNRNRAELGTQEFRENFKHSWFLNEIDA
jgi:hypothetical protein